MSTFAAAQFDHHVNNLRFGVSAFNGTSFATQSSARRPADRKEFRYGDNLAEVERRNGHCTVQRTSGKGTTPTFFCFLFIQPK